MDLCRNRTPTLLLTSGSKFYPLWSGLSHATTSHGYIPLPSEFSTKQWLAYEQAPFKWDYSAREIDEPSADWGGKGGDGLYTSLYTLPFPNTPPIIVLSPN